MKFTFPPNSKPIDGYTIKRGIHRGGFGEVYYAISDAGKEVALKLLHHNQEVELRGVQHCLNLKHKNLVTIFDVRNDADGDPWVIMEFVAGKTLFEIMEANPDGLPLPEILRWFEGTVAGLGYMHAHGIVHRDLKPANLFQEHDGTVKVGDVGLAKYISDSHQEPHTQNLGTVYYMAPEIGRGNYGKTVDVYSLGVLLYELLSGRVPFDGETAGEILMKHLTDQPDLSVLPREFRPVIGRALEKKPEARYQTVEKFFSAVQAAAGFEIDSGSDEHDAARTEYLPDSIPTENRDLPSAQPSFVTSSSLTDSDPLAETQPLLYSMNKESINQEPKFREEAARPRIADNGNTVDQTIHLTNPKQGGYRYFTTGLSYTPETRRSISLDLRMKDLTTSLSISFLSTMALTAVVWAVAFRDNPAFIALFAGITLCGAWAILLTSKISEGNSGDTGHRRFSQAVVGICVGAIAFLMHHFLLVSVSSSTGDTAYGLFGRFGSVQLLDAAAQPTLVGYVVFFGSLFALRRWWWLVDSFRDTRLRISSILFTLFVGYIITTVFAFPHVWGILLAAAIASVVQLSAAWIPPERRNSSLENSPTHA